MSEIVGHDLQTPTTVVQGMLNNQTINCNAPDASATQSMVRLIPLILGVSVFTMIANGILAFWRRYAPLLAICAIAGTIGVTMVHTLGADEASTKAAFTNGLVNVMTYNAHDLKLEMIINTGASRIQTFRSDKVQGILRSYLQGCQDSHFVAIASRTSAVLVLMLIAVPAAAKEFGSRVRKCA
ncbi:hypothetical protein OIDMADRAFT_56606 [Oidiodendron maius Zn]|uniref:Uncharacterized protein n=1 Tax=Oidiodendron maius (strain Zn) TaxID=913774 RepID=A0A0C3GQC7_OIDMZ|nr:hypothetical protein OIDMADRAFT_56606 [Oidiodendron maius Zn]